MNRSFPLWLCCLVATLSLTFVRPAWSDDSFSDVDDDAIESEWDEYYEEMLEELEGTDYKDEWTEYEDFNSDSFEIIEDSLSDLVDEYEEEMIPFEDYEEVLDWFEDDPLTVGGIGVLIGTGIGVAIDEGWIDSIDIPEIDLLEDEWYDWEHDLGLSGEWDWQEEVFGVDFDWAWTFEGEDFDINIDLDYEFDWYYYDDYVDPLIGVDVGIFY